MLACAARRGQTASRRGDDGGRSESGRGLAGHFRRAAAQGRRIRPAGRRRRQPALGLGRHCRDRHRRRDDAVPSLRRLRHRADDPAALHPRRFCAAAELPAVSARRRASATASSGSMSSRRWLGIAHHHLCALRRRRFHSTAPPCRKSWDVILGAIFIVLVLEAARRTTGRIMPLVAVCFILYAYVRTRSAAAVDASRL